MRKMSSSKTIKGHKILRSFGICLFGAYISISTYVIMDSFIEAEYFSEALIGLFKLIIL